MNAASSPQALAQRLQPYLHGLGLSGGEPVTVSVLAGGQSNPTYKLQVGGRQMVLRKQPAGSLVAGAHAIDREHQVMQSLAGTAVPVPRMLAYCDNAELLGTPFYLMDFLDGRVLVDPALPGMQPAERGALYAEMNRVIAALHQLDPAALGLGSYGRAGGYVARQTKRWSQQTQQLRVPVDPAMHQLMDWLPQHLPQAEETTLVHGDYRLDNLVWHRSEPQIIGVLDWELSTLGDPLADLAYHGMAWRVPPALWRGMGGCDLAALGIPDERAYLAMYAERAGRDPGPLWEYYLAFNLFRMAAILYGIAQRAADGTAAAADAVATGAKAGPLAALGWQCAQAFERG
ncbi:MULTISPECIES: phosphotransferase family protein [Comamonas]|uniref:phosphotransferase family protein n=1 Tax=Comamonas TaxID=283 RepID=UPI00391EE38F